MKKFNIKKEKFSETSSGRKFATLAKEFLKDKLSFFTTDMYYPFRNNCITSFSNHLTNSKNLSYFLRTIGFYTFPLQVSVRKHKQYKFFFNVFF